MRRVFADAMYWIAIAHRKDQWHAHVVRTMRSLGQTAIVTTEDVFDEFLAFYSSYGPALRNTAARTVEKAMANPLVAVRPQSHQSFLDGFALYKARPDKGYSLTDCISMATMRQKGIAEVLTNDDHFTQEGFIKLLLCDSVHRNLPCASQGRQYVPSCRLTGAGHSTNPLLKHDPSFRATLEARLRERSVTAREALKRL
jgi:predicted nucleic acid-binding protein